MKSAISRDEFWNAILRKDVMDILHAVLKQYPDLLRVRAEVLGVRRLTPQKLMSIRSAMFKELEFQLERYLEIDDYKTSKKLLKQYKDIGAKKEKVKEFKKQLKQIKPKG